MVDPDAPVAEVHDAAGFVPCHVQGTVTQPISNGKDVRNVRVPWRDAFGWDKRQHLGVTVLKCDERLGA